MPAMTLIRAGVIKTSTALLDGSESDGTQLLSGNAAMTADWSTANASLTASAVLAPNGATDGANAVEDTSNARHIIYQQRSSLTADATFRASIYGKYNTRRYMQLVLENDNGSAGLVCAFFDLQDGVVTDTEVTGAAQSVANASAQAGVNGYFKCSFDGRLAANVTSLYFIIAFSNVATYGVPLDSGNPQYSGDGSGFRLWRPKLVQL